MLTQSSSEDVRTLKNKNPISLANRRRGLGYFKIVSVSSVSFDKYSEGSSKGLAGSVVCAENSGTTKLTLAEKKEYTDFKDELTRLRESGDYKNLKAKLKKPYQNKAVNILDILQHEIRSEIPEGSSKITVDILYHIVKRNLEKIKSSLVLCGVESESQKIVQLTSPVEDTAIINIIMKSMLELIPTISDSEIKKGIACLTTGLNVVADILGVIPLVSFTGIPIAIKIVSLLIRSGTLLGGEKPISVVDEKGKDLTSQTFKNVCKRGVVAALGWVPIVGSWFTAVSDIKALHDAVNGACEPHSTYA